MSPRETGSSPEERGEIANMEAGFDIVEDIKSSLDSKDIAEAQRELSKVRAVDKYIVKNLPPVPPEDPNTRTGFYSPGHMLHDTRRTDAPSAATNRFPYRFVSSEWHFGHRIDLFFSHNNCA